MASSLRPSPIPATSDIANSKNGSRTISIPMVSTSIGYPNMFPNLLGAGRANPPSSAAVPPNPRCSTDAYGFDEGLGAATMPRWLWSCGAEPAGERAEDRAVGTCRGQIDTNAGGTLHDARGDLDQTKADRCKLCSR